MTARRAAPAGIALLALAALAAALPAGPAAAAVCPADTLGDAAERLAEGEVTVAYRTVPARIAVGAPFEVEVIACLGSYAPTDMSVDAAMPMHGHGMNYTPAMRRIAQGHAVFDGLVFHMPGDWVLNFDLFDGDRRSRLTKKVTVGK